MTVSIANSAVLKCEIAYFWIYAVIAAIAFERAFCCLWFRLIRVSKGPIRGAIFAFFQRDGGVFQNEGGYFHALGEERPEFNASTHGVHFGKTRLGEPVRVINFNAACIGFDDGEDAKLHIPLNANLTGEFAA